MPMKSYRQAINEALRQEMERVWDLAVGRNRSLWVATDQGIVVFDERQTVLRELRHDPADPTTAASSGRSSSCARAITASTSVRVTATPAPVRRTRRAVSPSGTSA